MYTIDGLDKLRTVMSKMVCDIQLNGEELEYIQGNLRRAVQEFYDDPISCFAGYILPEDVRAEVNRLKSLLTKFGLDFDAVVKEEATEYEIKRVQEMMND